MSISDSDNRIQLPPTEVDFDDVVGITGQDHDTFPAAGQQPRYDWMRSYLIGLLATQSSEDPPTQYRVGTPWFNRTKRAIYVWDGSDWVSLSNFIAISESTDAITSLADWIAEAQVKLDAIQLRITFGGSSIIDDATSIPVPESIQNEISNVVEFLSPVVYIDGLLIDPRSSRFSEGCPSVIELLNGVEINRGQRFVVIIERFDVIHADDVVVGS